MVDALVMWSCTAAARQVRIPPNSSSLCFFLICSTAHLWAGFIQSSISNLSKPIKHIRGVLSHLVLAGMTNESSTAGRNVALRVDLISGLADGTMFCPTSKYELPIAVKICWTRQDQYWISFKPVTPCFDLLWC